FSLPTWSNLISFPGGFDDPRIQAEKTRLTEDEFNEKYGGIPSPPSDRIFKEFRVDIHCGTYPYEEGKDVFLWIDPGYRPGIYAVEVAQIGKDELGDDVVYIRDEIFIQGYTTEDIIDVCEKKAWWKDVKGGAVDIAARQHQAMPAVADVWAQKAKLPLATMKIEIEEGIERLKTFLKVNPITSKPNFFIDLKAQGLISEFGGCLNPILTPPQQAIWKRDKLTGKPEERHEHAIKAVFYGLVNKFGYTRRTFVVRQRSYLQWK
ncbi:hypothetical protein LCGC14_1758550, partial [marine sediment metagenome]